LIGKTENRVDQKLAKYKTWMLEKTYSRDQKLRKESLQGLI